MSQNPHYTTLEVQIKELQQEITLLQYQLDNMNQPDPKSFDSLHKLYLDNLSIPDSVTKDNFYVYCKRLLSYYTTEEKLEQRTKELSQLYTAYINETVPMISMYLKK